jgi:hypothetical protein
VLFQFKATEEEVLMEALGELVDIPQGTDAYAAAIEKAVKRCGSYNAVLHTIRNDHTREIMRRIVGYPGLRTGDVTKKGRPYTNGWIKAHGKVGCLCDSEYQGGETNELNTNRC